jgi:hypothetical protein
MDGVNYHDAKFVNPDNPDIHTENIENMWMRVKQKLRRQFGMSRDAFNNVAARLSYVEKIILNGKLT